MDVPMQVLGRWARQQNNSTQQSEQSAPELLAEQIIRQDVGSRMGTTDALHELGRLRRVYPNTSLPFPSDPVERWKELLEWRHPRIDLNLLQLAVIFDRKEYVEYLWTPAFTREENYRDENARLVNHPLHLACRLGHSSALEAMGDFAEELLCEEGTVDLSQARLQRSTPRETSMEPNNTCSCEPGKSLDGAGSLEASSDNELLALMTRHNSSVGSIANALNPVVGTPMSLTDKEASMCVPLLFVRSLKKLFSLWEDSQPSTVESVWRAVEKLSRRGLTADEFRVCIEKLYIRYWKSCMTEIEVLVGMDSSEVSKNKVFHREVSILACQLLACVAEDTESFADSLKALWFNFVTMADAGEIELLLKAASYLPRKHFPSLVIQLESTYRCEYQSDPNSMYCQNLLSGLQRIEALAGQTGLQRLCMLKILESVRGDARAARNLTALPEPLRKRFHVPFQDLYERLTAESA